MALKHNLSNMLNIISEHLYSPPVSYFAKSIAIQDAITEILVCLLCSFFGVIPLY